MGVWGDDVGGGVCVIGVLVCVLNEVVVCGVCYVGCCILFNILYVIDLIMIF